jgi:hypothetical protein
MQDFNRTHRAELIGHNSSIGGASIREAKVEEHGLNLVDEAFIPSGE